MNDQIQAISARIREMREILDLQPEYMANALHVSTEEYLAYESGVEDIPIGALYAAAGVFGMDPTELLTGEAPRMSGYTIVRAGQGTNVERCPGYRFSALATNYIGRVMEPMIVEVAPMDGPPELISHGGQEFNLVLEGSIGVIYKDKEFILHAGDSIYFDPSVPHGQRSVTPYARFLTIINEWTYSK